MRVKMTSDDRLAENLEAVLTTLLLDVNLPGIADADDGLPVEVNVIETYAEAGLLTSDKGLVVSLSDGREVRLTISAYKRADQ
jgi:hypothetical protein